MALGRCPSIGQVSTPDSRATHGNYDIQDVEKPKGLHRPPIPQHPFQTDCPMLDLAPAFWSPLGTEKRLAQSRALGESEVHSSFETRGFDLSGAGDKGRHH